MDLLDEANKKELIDNPICTSAFNAVFGLGQKKMANIQSDMQEFGVKKAHENKGKKHGYPESAPIMQNIRKFFRELITRGGGSSPRAVEIMVNGITTGHAHRDSEATNKNVHLHAMLNTSTSVASKF